MLTGKKHCPQNELVVLDNITLKKNGRPLFANTYWMLSESEQWAILGPNGSGKSVLARVIAEEITPVSGEVRYSSIVKYSSKGSYVNSTTVRNTSLVSPWTHRSVISHQSSFYQSRWHSGFNENSLTVSAFLSQNSVEEINPFEINPPRSPAINFRRRQMLVKRLLQLSPLWDRLLLHLSNGEMRRVLLAHAFLENPKILVMDDPFAGLDSWTRQHLRTVINDWMRRNHHIILVTSRPDEIPSRVTHLILVEQNKIIAQGEKHRMLQHPLVKKLQEPKEIVPIHRNQKPQIQSNTSGCDIVVMNDITIRVGKKAILNKIEWTIKQGEHWALLGPNGSGKTTLLSLIQGDHPQTYAQDVQLFGIRPGSTQSLWTIRQKIGWLSPELHLHYPMEWNCIDVVCSGFFNSSGLHQSCSEHRRSIARQWLCRFKLKDKMQRCLGELSLGDQRLVLLARAMVKKPQLLVLDEPCQGIDKMHRRMILESIDLGVKETGATVIYVTHHKNELPQCITHLMKINAGHTEVQKNIHVGC